jgi:hypothetical protein
MVARFLFMFSCFAAKPFVEPMLGAHFALAAWMAAFAGDGVGSLGGFTLGAAKLLAFGNCAAAG